VTAPGCLRVVSLALLCLTTTATAQVDPRTALLERDGFAAVAAGEGALAADAFAAALAADPKNARLHLGAGLAAYLERRYADARLALERALALDPTLAVAREALGQVRRREGDLAGAIRTYDELVALRPEWKDVSATLERYAQLAERALESLNRAYWRVGDRLGMYPAHPVTVVLYTNEQFTDITRSPAWAAGAYDGTIRVPVRGALEASGELDRVLAHEFVHAVVRALAPRGVPAWLNEGLATALETEHLSWARVRLREAGGGSVKALLRATQSFGQLNGPDAQTAYAASAVAVSRLLEEAGGVAVANLLRDLGEGAELEVAFDRRMPRSFDAFADSLID
jgi:tetratricopeptide (TPR) repeat protein